jgi:hypothetical protein
MARFIFQKKIGYQENEIIKGSEWRCSNETLVSFWLWM